MPSSSDRDPRLYVEDMLAFCERALAYADGFDFATLRSDAMRYDAILRNIEPSLVCSSNASRRPKPFSIGYAMAH